MLYVPMKKSFFYKNLKINYQKVVVLIAEHLKVEIIKNVKMQPYSLLLRKNFINVHVVKK